MQELQKLVAGYIAMCSAAKNMEKYGKPDPTKEERRDLCKKRSRSSSSSSGSSSDRETESEKENSKTVLPKQVKKSGKRKSKSKKKATAYVMNESVLQELCQSSDKVEKTLVSPTCSSDDEPTHNMSKEGPLRQSDSPAG